MKIPKHILIFILFPCFLFISWSDKNAEFQYKKWTVSKPLFQKGPAGAIDDVSVKDPSIVFYNGKYHLFYTTKATRETKKNYTYISKNASGLGYVSAKTLEELNSAKRYNFNKIYESVIVAPQIFYFEPQKLWYIIAQTVVEGKPDLQPIYMTNNNIEDVNGWSKPQILKTKKMNNGFWIDFWVICDAQKAHLFYTDHEGSLFRFECPLEEFPHGFTDEKEETVLSERGENRIGRWRLHEASHIYYVKKEKKYLCLLEAVYPHPTRKNYWESRNRFTFAMIADKLEGPWERVETNFTEFCGDPAYLYNENDTPAIYDQVSHPELIRSGYDQNLEIEDYNLQLLFQAFDAENIGDDYDYNELPWELMLMRNY
jgi:endo-1,4-beta-xylanase